MGYFGEIKKGQTFRTVAKAQHEPWEIGEIVTVEHVIGISCFYSKEYPSDLMGCSDVELVGDVVNGVLPPRSYDVCPQIKQETLSRFCFHKADEGSRRNMTEIRMKVRELAYLIDRNCPESREKSTALTQLSFVMMAANSAIVQQCPIDESDLNEEERKVIA